jgi:uncharacterized protein YeaO (DUF488 family)
VALRVKSVWSPVSRKDDGLRILATRFRGRGLPTNRYDVWMPSLGPSERILKAYQARRMTWAAFVREFRQELFLAGPIDTRSRTIKNHGQKFTLRLIKQLAQKGNVTLMCHCPEDTATCHRHVLKALIRSGRV